MTESTPVLRVGIAGVGVGGSGLMRAFAGRPHLQLAAVADTREGAVTRFREEYGAEAYTSVAEMCESPNVDAVWVCTPNHFHAEHAITAAEHGKHVIVSKPIAITLDEAEAMNEAAESNGVRLLCGHTRSMAATIRTMAAMAQSGDYGKLGMVHSWKYADWLYRPRMAYELDETKGGGVVFRQGAHQIDIIRLIGGGVVKCVRGATLQLDPRRPAAGTYVAYLEFADGTPATAIYHGYGHFDTSELTYGRGAYRRPHVTGDTSREDEDRLKESMRYSDEGPGRAERNGEDNTLAFYGLTLVTCERADFRESPNGIYVYDDEGQKEIPVAKAESRGDNELEEMYQAVVHGAEVVHDGRWGEATLEVILGILESARTGREVTLSHQTSARVPAAT
jgi:phthalate 4,5-cis-dihydrodiol dehydrogenase